MRDVSKSLWEILSPVVMPIPTKRNWIEIADRYYQLYGMPNCIGSIDGKHIRIRKPMCSGSAYFNYKNYFSIVLMACVDADCFFTSVDIGDLGRNSDGRVFTESNLGKALRNKLLDLPDDCILPGNIEDSSVPFYFVADEAFPLEYHIMRPYPSRGLTNTKRHFNNILSKARSTVELTFGMILSKFRCLDTSLACNITAVDDIVKCICVLHNFIRAKEGKLSPEGSTSVEEIAEDRHMNFVTSRQITNDGKRIRTILTNYFMQTEPQTYNI